MAKYGDEVLRVRRHELDRNVPGLIQLLGSNAKDIRRQAVWGLGRLGDARATPYLMECVNDSDRLVRCSAYQALGVLRAKQARELLLTGLADSDDWVRGAAASALCRIGDSETNPEIRAALRTSLDRENDREVRLAIAESLVVLNDKEIRDRVPELIKALPWLRRGPQVKRLKRALELGQSLTPAPYVWELWRPERK